MMKRWREMSYAYLSFSTSLLQEQKLSKMRFVLDPDLDHRNASINRLKAIIGIRSTIKIDSNLHDIKQKFYLESGSH